MTTSDISAQQGTEITKLNSEILQLLNQQFSIVIGALAFFGAAVAVLLSDKLGLRGTSGAEAPIPLPVYVASLLIAAVLFLLCLWIFQLSLVLVRISVYLELRGLSQWETLYNEFTGEKSWSGRDWAHFSVFWILGGAALLSPILLSVQSSYMRPSDAWLLALVGGLVVYLGLTYALIAMPHSRRHRTKDMWKRLLQARKLLPETV